MQVAIQSDSPMTPMKDLSGLHFTVLYYEIQDSDVYCKTDRPHHNKFELESLPYTVYCMYTVRTCTMVMNIGAGGTEVIYSTVYFTGFHWWLEPTDITRTSVDSVQKDLQPDFTEIRQNTL